MSFAPGLLVPGHTDANVPLTLTLVVAGLASMGLVTAGILALVQRRSPSYLLIAAALVLLFGRTVMAALALNGMVADGSHHLIEHGIDVAMTALVFGAVYFARRSEPGDDGEPGGDGGERGVTSDTAVANSGVTSDTAVSDGGETR